MKRKNILFIMADQMAAPMLPFYGPSPIKLPNLSRLAAQGVVFDAAYCNSPLCAPSRFTLVSGQLPSKIGAYDNAADFPADVPTYAHYLRRLGYRTALSARRIPRARPVARLRRAPDQRHLPRRLWLGGELG